MIDPSQFAGRTPGPFFVRAVTHEPYADESPVQYFVESDTVPRVALFRNEADARFFCALHAAMVESILVRSDLHTGTYIEARA